MVGVQPAGCDPIVRALNRGISEPIKIEEPSTRALAVLVAEPLRGELAMKTIKDSQGLALSVPDSEILDAELQVAQLEGIFAEPASSATIAATKRLIKNRKIGKKELVVAVITGSGLKATDILQALTKKRRTAVIGSEISTKEKILRIINQEDAYGYDIWKRLGKTMTRGAIYQHLNELSEKGLLAYYSKNGRKFFKLTQRGRRALKAIDDLKFLI